MNEALIRRALAAMMVDVDSKEGRMQREEEGKEDLSHLQRDRPFVRVDDAPVQLACAQDASRQQKSTSANRLYQQRVRVKRRCRRENNTAPI